VSKAPPHNRLIAQAAREVLRPAGLTQKGRSRVWFDDHAWWLGVVEFQPSSWSRGTYLNVGVMWLWRPTTDHVYFDLGYRVSDAGFVDYESDEQFLPEARRVAVRAADEIEAFRGRIRGFDDAAEALRRDAGNASWAAWDRAVALGLAGRRREAAKLFRRVAASRDDRDWWAPLKEHATRLRQVVTDDPSAFRQEVGNWVARYREALRLPAVDPLA
jgi:hypothetical protein